MTPQQLIASLCRKYGPQVRVPADLDPAVVLWALAGCESEFGIYPLPKHEDGYCAGHRYDVPALTRRWGCAAHCSYGPWQMMFPHLEDILPVPLRDPAKLIFAAGDTSIAARTSYDYLCAAAVQFLNDEILGRQKASTLARIAKAWNHGNWRDQFDDSAYTDRAVKFYAQPFPPEVTDASAT